MGNLLRSIAHGSHKIFNWFYFLCLFLFGENILHLNSVSKLNNSYLFVVQDYLRHDGIGDLLQGVCPYVLCSYYECISKV